MIHPLANVDAAAEVHPDAEIAAFATVGADVKIGAGTVVQANAVILPGSRIGRDCKIYPGAVIGAEPQDLKFVGEYSTIEIGDRTTVREYCTLNRGTAAAGTTRIGSDCLIMAYVHVAHDCRIADRVVIANSVNLAGHVEIDYHATIGGMTGIVQFCKVGTQAMVAGGILVRKDVPPFATVARMPAQFMGVNRIGLRRRDFTAEQMAAAEQAYKYLYGSGMSRAEAISAIEATSTQPDITDPIVAFVSHSTQGIVRGSTGSANGAN